MHQTQPVPEDPTEGSLKTMANMSPVLANTAVSRCAPCSCHREDLDIHQNPWEHDSILVAPFETSFIEPTASFHIANYKLAWDLPW